MENICFTFIACTILLIFQNIWRYAIYDNERFILKVTPSPVYQLPISCPVMQNRSLFYVLTLSARKYKQTFWGGGNVLFADCSGSFTGLHICQNSLIDTLDKCGLLI